jgi:hypothetical protein
VRGRYELASRIFTGWSPLTVAALYFPIRGAVPIADAFAGHNTNVRVSIAVSIVYSVAVTAGGGAVILKNRKQSEELTRLRKRIEELEP